MKEKEKGDTVRLAVKSNLVDFAGSETTTNELPLLCPKPRRLRSAAPEILNHLRCNKHSQSNTADERSSGVVNMITEKTICSGCSPSEYSGSPPGRTPNPLVHDGLFMHQMEIISPLT